MGVYLYPSNTETELKNAYIGEWVDVTSLTLDKSFISLTTVGQTEQITATTVPAGATVNWSSDDTTVATVSSSGLVTCVTPGTCTITAESFGVTATCGVNDGSWQPGANTMIYYNWNNSTADQSGNNRDATASGTVSYGTNYIDLSSGELAVPDISYANDMTILFWVNANSNVGFMFDAINSGHNKMIVRFTASGMTSDFPSYNGFDFSPLGSSWTLLTAAYSSSGVKYYINGILGATKTAWSSAPGTARGTYIGAGWNGSGGSRGLYAGYFIIENKARTAQEISDYYNLTKGDYGIN